MSFDYRKLFMRLFEEVSEHADTAGGDTGLDDLLDDFQRPYDQAKGEGDQEK